MFRSAPESPSSKLKTSAMIESEAFLADGKSDQGVNHSIREHDSWEFFYFLDLLSPLFCGFSVGGQDERTGRTASTFILERIYFNQEPTNGAKLDGF